MEQTRQADSATVQFHLDSHDDLFGGTSLESAPSSPLPAFNLAVTVVDVAPVEQLTPALRGPCPHVWLCNRELDGGFRFLVLIAAFCGCFQFGFGYTTTIYVVPIGNDFNVGRSVSSLASSSGFLFFSLSCVAAGRLSEYFGPRTVCFVFFVIVHIAFASQCSWACCLLPLARLLRPICPTCMQPSSFSVHSLFGFRA